MKHKKQGSKSKGARIVVQETTEIETKPKVEIRRAGTLSQALTEPPVKVVKPETRVTRVQRKVKKSA